MFKHFHLFHHEPDLFTNFCALLDQSPSSLTKEITIFPWVTLKTNVWLQVARVYHKSCKARPWRGSVLGPPVHVLLTFCHQADCWSKSALDRCLIRHISNLCFKTFWVSHSGYLNQEGRYLNQEGSIQAKVGRGMPCIHTTAEGETQMAA